MTTSSANNSVFRRFFEKQKLTESNFINWHRQLRIVLSIEDKLNYLEQPNLPAPVALEGQQVAPKIIAAHATWIKGSKDIARLMRMTMDSEIQRNRANLGAYEMLQELKTLFAQQDEQELFQTMRELHSCKQEEGHFVSSYVLKMKSYIDNLEHFGYPATLGLGGLKGSRKLKPNALSLYGGDGQCAAIKAIRSYNLSLPSRLVIVLNNCHYAPSITRGIILVSCLYDDGYVNYFVDNSIQVSRNNMVYFSAVLRDSIFEIDLSDYYTNVSSMYALSNKRAKSNLDSTLLWHCRLGHISKKLIEKLKHDGLLNSNDLRDFEKYVPCLSGKMERNPYSHQVDRAKDLLGLICTDDHGIIAQHTPPYTPQQNGMSERRNRTLLDMVRSMMSQTTLLKSFWDYALETDARILNMVPTKKVEKTPYEVWHGQSPKLSYLKV
nr:zinc finger, CCHC-type [Tanacetum cinerariifolium]